MRLDVYHHFPHDDELLRQLIVSHQQLTEKVEGLIMKVTELGPVLQGIKDSLTEAGGEIAAKLEELSARIEAGETLPESDAALLTEIAARARALADIVPNQPPAEEPQA